MREALWYECHEWHAPSALPCAKRSGIVDAMRYLILSDIHANAVALEAVLRDARRKRWDAVLFLGDLVGYYTEPERAARLLMELGPQTNLLGNHDQLLLDLAAGKSSHAAEGDTIMEVLERHVHALSKSSLDFLAGFNERASGGNWQAVHGALRQPWEYVSTLQNAQANLPLLERRLCFVGHTHVPKVFASVESGRETLWRTITFRGQRSTYRVPPRAKVFFNPGSVGQPRDGSPLASYAFYDDELALIELYRVEFDLTAVQRSVRDQGYPESLARRLAAGR
jgi:predicted phosphodiesterase